MQLETKEVGTVTLDNWILQISEDANHWLNIHVQSKDGTKPRERGTGFPREPGEKILYLRFTSSKIEQDYLDQLETDYVALLEKKKEDLG